MSKNGHEVTPKVVPGTSSIATGSPASELKAALMFAWMAISRDARSSLSNSSGGIPSCRGLALGHFLAVQKAGSSNCARGGNRNA